MSRLSNAEATDLLIRVLYEALGEHIPTRDAVMPRLSPAQREETDAACARDRERIHAHNTARSAR
ncbi:hypothetical protein Ssi03_74590 [Sphaerisporangium siamense]|uniref:Uncharacterized protein n=1 Tax=Sphaerisporangium siamense TaxID=795645 RepID=A0A7W7GCT6_9ACTN|nr:hypothetical protein [Sphaerisporangium siamense]MBB4702311.1 hypothetical protein [Sphaerisporangium siamense]GII89469.1 hypothetical protein Ssi03_74590 [Sphaerisporangium siamense]